MLPARWGRIRLWLVSACLVGVAMLATRCGRCDDQPQQQPAQQFTEDVNDTGKDAVVAARAETPPKIDGVLDDECWKTATRLTTFRIASEAQRSPGYFIIETQPGEGLLATEQTEVLSTSDKQALYFAFVCHDSEPAKISAHQTQYDGGFWLDDYVTVCLDTFSDKTRCYKFQVNPLGTRADQRWDDWRWDARWQAGAKIGGDGWTAEIAIPFSILTMPKGAKKFGFQCVRIVQRKNEWSVWKYTKNYSDREFTWARLSGFDTGAAIRPDRWLGYLVGSRRFEEPRSTTGHAGFDWEHPITSTTAAMLTVNPDWSQIEAAHAGIDFTYVERFLPERRPFFVESIPYLPTGVIFYPQQRIYKFDEGLKLTGTEGRFRFGVLEMLGVQRFTDLPPENDLAARLWYDFNPETYFNISDVRSGTDDCTHYEFVQERKGRVNTRTVAAYYRQASDDPALGGSHSAFRTYAQTEDWFAQVSYANLTDNFDPQLGYVTRRGLHRQTVDASRSFHPKPGAAWFEKADVGAYYALALNHDGTLNYEESGAYFSLRQSPALSLGGGPSLYRHPGATGDPFDDVTYSVWANLFERKPTSAWMNATVGTIEESRYRNFCLGGGARTKDDRLAGYADLAWTGWSRRSALSLHSSEENAHQYTLGLTYKFAKRTSFSVSQRWLKQGQESKSISNAILYKQYGVDHELYVIYGDPQNPNETVKQIVVKYVMPFGRWGER